MFSSEIPGSQKKKKKETLGYVILIIWFKETNSLYAEMMKFTNVLKMEFLLKTRELIVCNSV